MGRPMADQRFVPSDPVPNLEHIGGVDAEFGNGFLVGGDGDEVFTTAGSPAWSRTICARSGRW